MEAIRLSANWSTCCGELKTFFLNFDDDDSKVSENLLNHSGQKKKLVGHKPNVEHELSDDFTMSANHQNVYKLRNYLWLFDELKVSLDQQKDIFMIV